MKPKDTGKNYIINITEKTMKKLVLALILLALAANVAFAGEDDKSDKKPTKKETTQKKDMPVEKAKAEAADKVVDSTKAKEPEIMTTKLGVKYQDLMIGKGKECKIGSRVDVHYTLWFADSTGKKLKRFQSSKDAGRSFQCTLGQRLITGWSDGMVGMKEGGTRRLIISPELGYGAGGGPIPANQWLVFEIDFLKHL